MEKVLINLYVPAVEMYFDVFIPVSLNIRTVTKLLGKVVMNISNGRYMPSGNELLCSVDKQQIFGIDHNLADYDVKNGEVLMLC